MIHEIPCHGENQRVKGHEYFHFSGDLEFFYGWPFISFLSVFIISASLCVLTIKVVAQSLKKEK